MASLNVMKARWNAFSKGVTIFNRQEIELIDVKVDGPCIYVEERSPNGTLSEKNMPEKDFKELVSLGWEYTYTKLRNKGNWVHITWSFYPDIIASNHVMGHGR